MAAPPDRPTPKLSIGLPVYNAQAFLPQALDCLLAQTFADFEIVISDNASADRTEQICRDYASRDPRIRYFRNVTNLGAIANFNRTFELSSAPLFKWAAHDDHGADACAQGSAQRGARNRLAQQDGGLDVIHRTRGKRAKPKQADTPEQRALR